MDASVPVVVLATGHVGHGIARSLGRLGVRLYGVHADPRSPAGRSRFWHERLTWNLMEEDEAESVAWLLQLAERIGTRPVLIPTGDISALFVADHALDLEESFLMPPQTAGLSRALSNKRQMYVLCKQYSVPTAETRFPASRGDVENFAAEATYPLMLKGIDTETLRRRTGVGMVIVDDAASLLARYDELETPGVPNLMIQEYIPGGAEEVWMLNGYFDHHSDLRFSLTGKKMRQYPAYTGLTSLGVCVWNDAVTRQTVEFMKRIEYRGVLDIGYKHDVRTGEYKLLDVNPRVGTTFRLFVDSAGMDVVRALYLDLTGQRVWRGRPCEGRKWVVENFDIISSLRYWRDGNLGFRDWLSSLKGLREASWFARDDLAPFAMMSLRSVEWAFENLRKS